MIDALHWIGDLVTRYSIPISLGWMFGYLLASWANHQPRNLAMQRMINGFDNMVRAFNYQHAALSSITEMIEKGLTRTAAPAITGCAIYDLVPNPTTSYTYDHAKVTVLGMCGHWWQTRNDPLEYVAINCPRPGCDRPVSHVLAGRVIFPQTCDELEA